ncbi:MAG TPA: ferritin-like domain-containing protein [Acidimicrobiales bacterium]|nr:ferritin-like domain-containing protein [Acidimicrobiales bacterium]
MATDADILGRAEQDDLDAILAVKPDWDAAIRNVRNNADTIFTWDYERSRTPLSKLYEKAKTAQWNGSTDLDWSIDVDQELLAQMSPDANPEVLASWGIDLTGTPMAKWTKKEWTELAIHQQNFMLSQFMHGEQGALICTAKIVETVPWIDAKYYAATQVMDEARHVEVFARYLDEKLNGHFPLNPHLGLLLDDIIGDERWDFTYLGMQIMVEGLALAAFGLVQAITPEPLLQKLLRYVMSDEARHVAFGVLSLKEFYEGLTDKELGERQEFAYEAAVRLRDRLVAAEVWERMGVDPKLAITTMRPPGMSKNDDPFQMMLFSKIVPNLSKLGLLDANGQWLRKKFDNIGLTQFETWTDTSIEYELLDAVTADREAAAAESA